jgi:hypothetical protein
MSGKSLPRAMGRSWSANSVRVRTTRSGAPRTVPEPAVRDDVDAHQQTAPADVPDDLVAVLEGEEAILQVGALVAGGIDQLLLGDDVEHGQPDIGGQGLVQVRGEEEKAFAVGLLLDGRRGGGGGQRDPAAQRLRHRQEIGRHAVPVTAPEVARAPEAGLGLGEDHQHVALAGQA